MLKIIGLTKTYGNSNKKAVEDVTLELKEGEIFGFLGKNGAGKSTTIKCATGILPFETGEITINGFNIKTQPTQAKSLIGYVPDNHAIYEKMTANEYIYYMGILYGQKADDVRQRAKFYLEKFELAESGESQIKSFSHGMKQKVSLIAAIIHNPKLWILDEPLVGLDPQTSLNIMEFMKTYAHVYKNTIFFSSHNIDMVEKLCDRVAIIKRGKIIDVLNLHVCKHDIPNFDLEKVFIERTGD